MSVHIVFMLVLVHSRVSSADWISQTRVRSAGTNFIPANPVELLGTDSSVSSTFQCARQCHTNVNCRTFVFDRPQCRLYETLSSIGSIVASPSATSVVGTIDYSNLNLTAMYNQSYAACFANRYLVYRNGRCQCPLGTYWDGQGQCLNQLFPDSSLVCNGDDWCRQDMNLSCLCGKCRCPMQTFWSNKSCIPQLFEGSPCNTSDQCRNDLNLTCSRTNKTCARMSLKNITVVNGTIPAKYSNVSLSVSSPGGEWYRAFDNNPSSVWNALSGYVPNFMLMTFNDEYLLSHFLLTVYGDYWHDPKIVEFFLDENATCSGGSFSYPAITNNSISYFTSSFLNSGYRPVIARQVLLAITRWSPNQVWLSGLALYGGLA